MEETLTICLYLPICVYMCLCLYLPISPDTVETPSISIYLPISAYICLYLPISPDMEETPTPATMGSSERKMGRVTWFGLRSGLGLGLGSSSWGQA
jgi:hypothetical protein